MSSTAIPAAITPASASSAPPSCPPESTAIVGPSGTSSDAILDHWTAATPGNGEIESYAIQLTGVRIAAPNTPTSVPESNQVFGTLALGILMLALRQKIIDYELHKIKTNNCHYLATNS